MKSYRNKEGYYDPTAGKAIKKADIQRKRANRRSQPLVYRVGHIPEFKAIKEVVR